ncbi:MAG: pentapeptide repeat-containing protein [Cyanobacteriota bacterium]|nr:pentapeptide repeat-containing protein [Cyanobacteriota bacterium]
MSKQRPWQSAEENWLAAERACRQWPWRPWLIRFSGDKERSGWDWADLLLKVSVPVLILGLSTAYSVISSSRQQQIALDQKESDVVTEFIQEMKPLLLEKGLASAREGSTVIGVARGLTLATLSRLRSEEAPLRRTIILQYLLDAGVTSSGGFFSLANANLSGVNLSRAKLPKADFAGVNLQKAVLIATNLSGAYLGRADLSGANLVEANLGGANLIESDISEAKLYNANLRGANLGFAVLAGAQLNMANLSEANLGFAKLPKADLNKANLNAASLTLAIFREANLSGATLNGADLSGADLRGANLDDVQWNQATIWPTRDQFKGVKNMPKGLRMRLGI